MAGNPFDEIDAEAGSRRWARLRRISLAQYGGILALVIVAGGIVAIGIGYFGAAGKGAYVNGVTDIRGQLPYLLSGGFLGLSLVVLGAAVIVAQAHRVDRARLESKLDEVAAVLRTSGQAAPGDLRGLFVAGATSYHTPQCRLVEGREGVSYLTAEEAAARGLNPCRICRPRAAEETSRAAAYPV